MHERGNSNYVTAHWVNTIMFKVINKGARAVSEIYPELVISASGRVLLSNFFAFLHKLLIFHLWNHGCQNLRFLVVGITWGSVLILLAWTVKQIWLWLRAFGHPNSEKKKKKKKKKNRLITAFKVMTSFWYLYYQFWIIMLRCIFRKF